MNLSTIVNMLAQLAMLAVVVQMLRGWTDRRALCDGRRDALYGAVAFAAALLVLSGLMAGVADGRQFIAVRQIAEYGSIVSAIAGMMAIQMLKGKRK